MFRLNTKQPTPQEPKTLSSILSIFTTVREDLVEFTSSTTAELEELKQKKATMTAELEAATTALAQIESIVPTPK